MVATTETKTETPPALRDSEASDGRRVENAAEVRSRKWKENPNIRPEMMAHFEASIAAHYKLGELLAQHDIGCEYP